MTDYIPLIEKIIQEKTFDQLTPEELSLLGNHGIDENQFNIMKALDKDLFRQGVEEMSTMKEPRRTLSTLQAKFREKSNPGKPSLIETFKTMFRYRIPAYQPAILFILLTAAYYIYNPLRTAQPERSVTRQVVYRTDTVYRTLAPDTVKILKTVYRNRYIKSNSQDTLNQDDMAFSRERYNQINSVFPASVGVTYDESSTIPEFLVSDK